ncbi:hypothetical protein [Paracoccus sp. (in: a-proteobacteria)]
MKGMVGSCLAEVMSCAAGKAGVTPGKGLAGMCLSGNETMA